MAWSIVVGVTLFIAYNLDLATAYQQLKVSQLCPFSPLQGSFNQIYSNRPVVKLGNDTESAAIVRGTWDKDNIKEFQDCAFIVDSNLYFDAEDPSKSQQIGRGLVATIRKINFRFDETRIFDYVRFTFPGYKTEKISGVDDYDSENGRKSFFIVPTGVIKVHIFVDKLREFTAAQPSIEVELVFTAYQRCDGTKLLQCHSSDANLCLPYSLVSDGIRNCPYPSNADEPNNPFPLVGTEQEKNNYMKDWQNEQKFHKKRDPNGATQLLSMGGLFYLITIASLVVPTMF